MSSESPVSVLFSSEGLELAVTHGSAIPAGTRGILSDGTDGTNARTMLVDGYGRQIVVGAGTAGAQTGGLLTIQGDPAGTPIPISGSITATNPSVTTINTAPPSQITFVGGDVTTAPPTYTNNTTNALSLTTTGLLRVDGSNVTQPVSGTVTSNQGTPNTLTNAWPVEITDGYNILGTTAHPVAVSGFVVTNKASTSLVMAVVGSTSNFTLLASNTARIAATIYNGTNKILYVKYGTTASVASFSMQLFPNSYFEVQNDWVGQIDAISPTGVSGNVLVSELTA